MNILPVYSGYSKSGVVFSVQCAVLYSVYCSAMWSSECLLQCNTVQCLLHHCAVSIAVQCSSVHGVQIQVKCDPCVQSNLDQSCTSGSYEYNVVSKLYKHYWTPDQVASDQGSPQKWLRLHLMREKLASRWLNIFSNFECLQCKKWTRYCTCRWAFDHLQV